MSAALEYVPLDIGGDRHSARMVRGDVMLLGGRIVSADKAELAVHNGKFRQVVDLVEARPALVAAADELLFGLRTMVLVLPEDGGDVTGEATIGVAWDRHRALWLARNAV